MVRASDFNKDLDRYISGRSEKKDWSLFTPKKRPQEEQEVVPEDLRSDEVRVIEHDRVGFWERLFSGRRADDLVSEDLSEDEMQRLDAMKEDMERIDEVEREHPEVTEELEEVRESLLDRFFAFFRLSERRHRLEDKAEELAYIENEVVPKIDEDVKAVLCVTHRWLEKLPKKEKAAFKKGEDFQQYKAILEKYGLAKK